MNTPNWPIRANDFDFRIRNFIDGHFTGISTGEVLIDKHSPRDGRLLYQLGSGTVEDVNIAVANAKEAFEDGRWRSLPMAQRQAALRKLADLIDANTEELALNESLDVGKPISYARYGDIPGVAHHLRSAAELADKLLSPSGADGSNFSFQLRKPVGVVGAIVGWNYPLSLAATKVGPALVMGNSLVLKPSEFTSLSASRLAELAIEAGVPPGVFNVVHGDGKTVGDRLAHHPDVDLLAFVGSSATGKQLMISSGQSNMKRLILECGGKSPFLAFDDCADLDATAEEIVDNAFPNQGALCVAGTRLILQDSVRDKLLPLILEKAAAIKAADPLDPGTRFGALMSEAHMNKVLGYIDSGISEGAKLILGGKRVYPQNNDALTGGFYIEPTIFDAVDPAAKIAQEEIFGPVLSIFSFSDEAEAIALANNSKFGLAAYAATTDVARVQRLSESINAGNLMVYGSAKPRFGTVGITSEKQRESGMGYSSGAEGLQAYTASTTVRLMT